MPAPTTYSFLDVLAAITGPGGSFNLGSGSGAAEEGITFAPSEELDTMTIGADGGGMHSLHANKSGKVTIRLLKMSPTNSLLSTMMAFQRASGATHGQNTISCVNKTSGDSWTCQLVAFAKQPEVSYSKVGEMITWEFNAIVMNMGLGAGVPV